jgi:hypothetical protein
MPQFDDVLCWTPLAEFIRSRRRLRQRLNYERSLISDLLNRILLAHKETLDS